MDKTSFVRGLEYSKQKIYDMRDREIPYSQQWQALTQAAKLINDKIERMK